VDIETYRKNRQALAENLPQHRPTCGTCFQPQQICYCPQIQKFNPLVKFVILIHPIEHRRRIATGRMSHLCLENSHLFRGHNFTHHKDVNALLSNPDLYPVILYPGTNSKNLTLMADSQRGGICPLGKTLTIFVLDGTWATAKKMLKHSHNLRDLPKICFTPDRPSNFRVRKQPREGYFSTIEAIHHTIDLLGPSFGFPTERRTHDALLRVFDSMVEVHLEFIQKSHERQGPSRYRRHET
jgi:DTW domain-containing protein YfiP